jgi:predicted nucleic acid-binding Zn ribbon protein
MNLPSQRPGNKMKQPLSMDSLVEKVWEDWGIGEEETSERILSGNWQKIVGKNLAGKCAPINLSKDGKTLQIRAASSTIKQELSFKKAEILIKINKLKKCRSVKELRIF